MGYWGTSANGVSFADGRNEDGTEMLWGDSPADALDGGLEKLIFRLRGELGRFPTVEEVDTVKATAPEMIEAIELARQVFAGDVERPATDAEVQAGLAFADTEINLDLLVRNDIQIGDVVRWAIMKECGFFAEIDYLIDGVVQGIGERDKEQWGRTHTVVYYRVVDHNGIVHAVDRGWATKVLPGDQSVEEVNAYRRSQARGFDY